MTDVETIAQALHQATELAVSLHKKHFGEIADWTPLDDLAGVLLQIDNMTTGITRTEQWNTDMDAAKGEGVVLIEAYVDCKRRVSTGGWDDHWTSERWVYDSNRIPIGTIPTRWMNLPPE